MVAIFHCSMDSFREYPDTLHAAEGFPRRVGGGNFDTTVRRRAGGRPRTCGI